MYSKYLSIILLLIGYLSIKLIRKPEKADIYYKIDLFAIAFYSIIGWLPLSSALKLNLSISALGILLATGFYLHLSPMIESAALKQKSRALKKVPFLVIAIFFTLSNSVEASLCYIMVGLGLILLKRNLKVAFFSWPFLIAGFLEKSVIIEVLVISSQLLGIYLLKDKNE